VIRFSTSGPDRRRERFFAPFEPRDLPFAMVIPLTEIRDAMRARCHPLGQLRFRTTAPWISSEMTAELNAFINYLRDSVKL
jgi:hypothetical protein